MKKTLNAVNGLLKGELVNLSKHPGFIIPNKCLVIDQEKKVCMVFAKLGTSSPITLFNKNVLSQKYYLDNMGNKNWLELKKNTKSGIIAYQNKRQVESYIGPITKSQMMEYHKNPNYSSSEDFIKVVMLHLITFNKCIFSEERIGQKITYLPFSFKEEVVDYFLNEKNYNFDVYSLEYNNYLKKKIFDQKKVIENIRSSNYAFQFSNQKKINPEEDLLDNIDSNSDPEF